MTLIKLRRAITSLLLLYVAASFVFLIAELVMMGHVRGTQLIAVGAAVFGLVLSLVALNPRPELRIVVGILFFLLFVVGLFGMFEHQSFRLERRAQATAAGLADSVIRPEAGATTPAGAPTEHDTAGARANQILDEALRSYANSPPPFSPLALSGLALLGILALLTAAPEPAAEPAPARTTPAPGD